MKVVKQIQRTSAGDQIILWKAGRFDTRHPLPANAPYGAAGKPLNWSGVVLVWEYWPTRVDADDLSLGHLQVRFRDLATTDDKGRAVKGTRLGDTSFSSHDGDVWRAYKNYPTEHATASAQPRGHSPPCFATCQKPGPHRSISSCKLKRVLRSRPRRRNLRKYTCVCTSALIAGNAIQQCAAALQYDTVNCKPLMPAITVSHLTRTFTTHVKQPGFIGALGGLFRREYITKTAVDDVSFSVEPGEFVGFLGP
jgi:hypothetical protein